VERHYEKATPAYQALQQLAVRSTGQNAMPSRTFRRSLARSSPIVLSECVSRWPEATHRRKKRIDLRPGTWPRPCGVPHHAARFRAQSDQHATAARLSFRDRLMIPAGIDDRHPAGEGRQRRRMRSRNGMVEIAIERSLIAISLVAEALYKLAPAAWGGVMPISSGQSRTEVA